MASVRDEVGVYEYSGGIVGPGIEPAATVRSGGIIRTGTPMHADVIPEMLGGANTLMMGRVMWNEFFNNADWPMAAAVTCVMVLLLLVPLSIFQYNQARQLEGRS